jgi:hypothetical protein
MENKKDIGKAINDKLNPLEKTPRKQVWSGISYELQKKKKRKGAFFFFWTKTIGLTLVGIIAAAYFYTWNDGSNLFSPDNPKDSITIDTVNGETISISPNAKSTKKNTNETEVNDSHATKGDNISGNKNGDADGIQKAAKNKNSNGKNAVSKENIKKEERNSFYKTGRKGNFVNASSKSAKGKSNLLSKAKTKKGGNKFSKKSKSKKGKENTYLAQAKTTENTIANVDLSTLQNKKSTEQPLEIKTKKTDSLVAKKEKYKPININMFPKDSVKQDSAKTYRKFYVDAFVSPTIYGYFAKGSTLDTDLDSLPRKSEIKFSYGFGLTYDLTEKVSVRIGYRKIDISYVTKNAPIGINMQGADNFTGISYDAGVSNTSIYTASGMETMDITQKISYTEIPLEIKYKFLDKKIGLKSSFGFSYFMLDENKVSIKTLNGYSLDIGKTKNLSSTSVSVNFGLEIDYPLFKNTKIFVEPMFNYQIKAFSDGNFKPYVFGIHTGIRYSFNSK